jgi:hypothetical protein
VVPHIWRTFIQNKSYGTASGLGNAVQLASCYTSHTTTSRAAQTCGMALGCSVALLRGCLTSGDYQGRQFGKMMMFLQDTCPRTPPPIVEPHSPLEHLSVLGMGLYHIQVISSALTSAVTCIHGVPGAERLPPHHHLPTAHPPPPYHPRSPSTSSSYMYSSRSLLSASWASKRDS